ncbi:serine/threonine-protein kinase [Actinomadura rifamycini]|uniref:serine/threonine-protein kinase n=1 Tax=Actinomadura rifamycini TaxID=31962 RepID=UPI000419734B|nr:serine/threonine-protein kinase [Actinomadura rifamycini]
MTHVVAGRYELVEPLGRNGTGPVWRARDLVLDREVAVQEVSLPERLGPDRIRAAHARVAREAGAAARLDHPGLVTVHDVVEEGGRPWVAARLVRAGSLAALIERDGPLPPERAAALGLDLLGALRAAHAAGLVHRDVEPGTVLIEAGRPVLAALGTAPDAADERAAPPGALACPAPERAAGHPATAASDLWELGATLFAAVEGHPPYPRAAAASTEPAATRLAGPLAPVLHGLLRRAPEQRVGHDEAERLLRQAAAPGAAAWAAPGTPPPFPPALPPAGPTPAGELGWGPGTHPGGPPPRTGPRWTVIVPAAVVAVVLVVAAVAVAVLLGLDDDADPGAPIAGATSETPGAAAPSNPAEYREHRGDGFAASVPAGWETARDGEEVSFSDPAEIRSISLTKIGAAEDPLAPTDVAAALRNAAESFASDPVTYPGYREERFTEFDYMGDDAAELQFTFTAGGVEARMLMRLFRFGDTVHSAILTADLGQWDASLPHYETFLRTLRAE